MFKKVFSINSWIRFLKRAIKSIIWRVFGVDLTKALLRNYGLKILFSSLDKGCYSKWLSLNYDFNDVEEATTDFLVVIEATSVNIKYINKTIASLRGNPQIVIAAAPNLHAKLGFQVVEDYRSVVSSFDGIVTIIKAGDTYLPETFSIVAKQFLSNKNLLALYFDEDIEGKRDPFFKPDYNFDFLVSRNYIGNAVFFRSKVFDASIWNTLLKLKGSNVAHIAIPAYKKHHKNLQSNDSNSALIEYAERFNNENRELEALYSNGHIQYRLKGKKPLVSAIIPTKDRLDLLSVAVLGLLDKTSYKNVELIIVDNGSSEEECLHFLEEISRRDNVKVIRDDSPFNYAYLNNLGARYAKGEMLLLMNNDLEIIQDDWLDELVALLSRSDTASASPLLLYPNGKVQHAGVILGLGGLAAHAFSGKPLLSEIFKRYVPERRDFSALCAACLLVKKQLFDEVSGFDEKLAIAFNDVDLTLKFSRLNYLNVLSTNSKLIHHESASRGFDSENEEKRNRCAREADYVINRYHKIIASDPAYNTNLTLHSNDFSLAYETRTEKFWLKSDFDTSCFVSRDWSPELNIYRNETNLERIKELYRKRPQIKIGNKDGLSVLIVTKDAPQYIIPLVKQLITQGKIFIEHDLNYEILLADTGTTDKTVLDFYKKQSEDVKIFYNQKYHFSRCNNFLANEASSNTLLLLNNDIILPDSEDTLYNGCLKLSNDKDLAAIGAVLHYPDGKIQHCGCDFLQEDEVFGLPFHVNHRQFIADIPKEKSYLAVTGAFLMVKGELYSKVSGLDEGYQSECQDIAFCLELSKLGYEIKCLDLGYIVHIENATRPKRDENFLDRRRFLRKYFAYIELLQRIA